MCSLGHEIGYSYRNTLTEIWKEFSFNWKCSEHKIQWRYDGITKCKCTRIPNGLRNSLWYWHLSVLKDTLMHIHRIIPYFMLYNDNDDLSDVLCMKHVQALTCNCVSLNTLVAQLNLSLRDIVVGGLSTGFSYVETGQLWVEQYLV